MMKKLCYLFVIFFGTNLSGVYAQYRYPFLAEYFFMRNPSARMEAMGKTYAPTESELSCVFKNPAGVSNIKGLELNFSYSSPYYLLKDAKYLFAGVGYTYNKYISAAAAVNRFDYGIQMFTDNGGNPIPGPSASPHLTDYSFSFSSNPFKNFNVGVTANYFIIDYPSIETRGVFFPDLGAIKYFDIGKKEKIKHKIFVGQSLSDFTSAKAAFKYYGDSYQSKFPEISRTEIGYNVSTRDSSGEKSLNSHEATFVFEYEDEINSKYETSFRFGLEYKLFSILSIRFGYYYQKIFDYDIAYYNKSHLNDFTYGIGVSLPLELMTKSKTPFTIKFNFANLRQPRTTQKGDYGRFTSFDFSLNYVFKKTKK